MPPRRIARPSRQPRATRRESPQPRMNNVMVSRAQTEAREKPQARKDNTIANREAYLNQQAGLGAAPGRPAGSPGGGQTDPVSKLPCMLLSTSDSVSAIAYDKVEARLYVANGTVIDVLQYSGLYWVRKGTVDVGEAMTGLSVYAGRLVVSTASKTIFYDSNQYNLPGQNAGGVSTDVLSWSLDEDSNPDWQDNDYIRGLSWYQEVGEFPKDFIVVAEASQVTIYDVTSGALVSWMVFLLGGTFTSWTDNTLNMVGNTGNFTSVAYADGVLYTGQDTGQGTRLISFVADTAFLSTTTEQKIYGGTVSQRNAGAGYEIDSGRDGIVDNTVNDVAAKVLGGTLVQNLLLWSEDLSKAVWSKTDTTVDGKTLTQGTAGTAGVLQEVTGTTDSITSQLLVEPVVGQYLNLATVNAAFSHGYRATFDLVNGTITSESAVGSGTGSAQIQKEGDAYRVSVHATTNGSSDGEINFFISNAGSGTGRLDNAQYIVHESQLEVGANPHQYVPSQTEDDYEPVFEMPLKDSLDIAAGAGPATFTRASTATYVSGGLVKMVAVDEPRFEAEGLLIEGESTNELTWSTSMNNSWPITRATVEKFAAVGPEGLMTALELTADGSTSSHYARQDPPGIVTDQPTAFSCFFKFPEDSTLNEFNMEVFGDSGTFADRATIKYFRDTGVVTGSDFGNAATAGRWVDYIGDGWYRARIHMTTLGPSQACRFITGSVGPSSPNQAILLWGSQAENLPFVTSFIPTEATVVTRQEDNLVVPESNVPARDQDQTWAATVRLLGKQTNKDQYALNMQGSTFRHLVADRTVGDTLFRNSSALSAIGLTSPVSEDYRVVGTFDGATLNQAIYTDGARGTDNTSTVPADDGSQLRVGSFNDGDAHLFGHIKDVMVYDTVIPLGQSLPTVVPPARQLVNRTNNITWSEDLTKGDSGGWRQGLYNGGSEDYWSRTEEAIADKDAFRLEATATPNTLFARNNTTKDAVDNAASLSVYIPASATGLVEIRVDYQDVDLSAWVAITERNQWVRVSLPAVSVALSRNWIDFEIRYNGITPPAGWFFYCTEFQNEYAGAAAGYIPTGTTEASVTDDFDLFIPTWGAATDGGVSVGVDTGDVWDITGFTTPNEWIDFTADDKIVTQRESNNASAVFDVPSADALVGDYKRRYFPANDASLEPGSPKILRFADGSKIFGIAAGNCLGYWNVSGLTLIFEDLDDYFDGLSHWITTTYNTGPMRTISGTPVIGGAWGNDNTTGCVGNAFLLEEDFEELTNKAVFKDSFDAPNNVVLAEGFGGAGRRAAYDTFGRTTAVLDPWTLVGNGSATIAGEFMATNDGTGSDRSGGRYALATEVGKWYKHTFKNTGDFALRSSVGTTPDGVDVLPNQTILAAGDTFTFYWQALSTTSYIRIFCNANTANRESAFDNFIVEEVPGLDGWTDASTGGGVGLFRIEDGKLVVGRNTGSGDQIQGWKAFPTVVNRIYQVSFVQESPGGGNSGLLIGSNGIGGSDLGNYTNAPGLNTYTFTATTTTTSLAFRGNSNSTEQLIDDVVVEAQAALDGWSIPSSTRDGVSSPDGNIRIENITGFARSTSPFSTVVGRWYRITAKHTRVDADAGLGASNNADGSSALVTSILTASGEGEAYFQATATTTYAALSVQSGTVGLSALFDDVLVQEVPALEGWDSNSGAILSVENGVLRVTEDGQDAATARAVYSFPTDLGVDYVFGVVRVGASSSPSSTVAISPNTSIGSALAQDSIGNGETAQLTFTGTGGNLNVLLNTQSITTGQYVDYDNVTVQEVTADVITDNSVAGNDGVVAGEVCYDTSLNRCINGFCCEGLASVTLTGTSGDELQGWHKPEGATNWQFYDDLSQVDGVTKSGDDYVLMDGCYGLLMLSGEPVDLNDFDDDEYGPGFD